MSDRCTATPEVHLNPNVRELTPSATIAINERSIRRQAEGREVFRLGLGQSPFPVPEVVVAALRDNAHRKDYLPVEGLPELRAAVAEHHRRTFGIDCTADNVLVGPGSKELVFLLQLVYEGDIIIPAPSWVSYEPQARIIGRRVHPVATRREDRWLLTPQQLDELCSAAPGRPRILILNYPSNPTGQTYTARELDALAEVAARHRVVVLSDEIYGKLHHDSEHASLVPRNPDGTIFSGGLSKWCGAGGWRLGVFVIPDRMRWLLDAMAAVASETFASTSAPIQCAAVTAFQQEPSIDSYLAQCRRVLAALGNHLAETMRKSGLDVLSPDGGFYLFPDFTPLAERLARRGIDSAPQLCERLLEETGVAVLPASDFGCAPDHLGARLAYVDFDGAEALEASAASAASAAGTRLGEDFLRRYCGRTVEAVDRLCDWVDG